MHVNELAQMHDSTIREEDRKVQEYAKRCIAKVEAVLKDPSPERFRSGQIEIGLPDFPDEKLHFRKWRDGVNLCKDHYKGKGWQVLGGYKGHPPNICLFARIDS